MYNFDLTRINNDFTVCFGDSLLRKADIELLQGPSWLNDTIIAFYFEYLESKIFRNKSLLCVPPQVTQCVKMISPSEIGAFLEPLNAHKKTHILFALNDHEFCEAAGGTHWSLLVYSKADRIFYHFDSCRGLNKNHATDFCNKLGSYFGRQYQNSLVEVNCLQQNNNYDCGVHVLCNAEKVMEHVLKYRTLEGCPKVDEHMVMSFRGKMLKIIMSLDKSQSL